MCSDCSDHEPECSFCGINCMGECEDPDRCPSCWNEEYYGDYDIENCVGIDCDCDCHENDFEDAQHMFSVGVFPDFISSEEVITIKPKLRPGVFPFLKLPGELRNKVYHWNMKQYGEARRVPFFKGRIDTALLRTCRQINKEARHIPLSINTLSFVNPFHAYRFLGFGVVPSQKNLLKSVHVDVHGLGDFHGLFSGYLLPELAKISLMHLSVTLQGRIEVDWFTKIKCLEKCLSQVKGLTSFDLVIGSGVILGPKKDKIVDALRKKLVTTPEAMNNPLKRKVSDDNSVEAAENLRSASKKKTAMGSTITTKSGRKSRKKGRTKKDSLLEKEPGPDEELVRNLVEKYGRLEDYARAHDEQATSVEIRLGRAREAAIEGKVPEFEKLAKDILDTLEVQFTKIITSRNLLPYPLSSTA